ncbi:alpha/beta fold hydrolase [Gottfriedia sp. NPDC056225]|uniref:alpha/beta fold hydrolase n=1 Tax=Gottfriedia sp. NPDC056225 TaxID=3345751 RepID=UPI0015596DD9|nr:alpha/beta fold hydrolase [Arthrobacter citreus]
MFVTGELGTYHVRIKGDGKVTVLLECGMMHTLHQWRYLQDELSKYAKVITYDRLGYGKSGIWTTERSTEQQAFECYDLLLALNINSPLIAIGHSLGAYIMFQLSRLFPNAIQSMILLDPTHPTLEEHEQKIYDKLLYQFALMMKKANQINLTKAIPNKFIHKIMNTTPENQSEIISSIKSFKHWKTVVSEWKNLNYSNSRIKEALKIKINTPLLVLTASNQSGLQFNAKKKKELLNKVEKYHKEYCETTNRGSHHTLEGYTHSSIYGNNEENAKSISHIIKKQIDLLY